MNILHLLGTMMFRPTPVVYMAGVMMHAANSVVFALIHVGIYEAIDLDSNLAAWGLLFGAVHYMVSGMAMGMMPMMHAGIRAGTVHAPGAFAMATHRFHSLIVTIVSNILRRLPDPGGADK